jgi:GTP:adenosylcobinamide-phosphate guanylyltransferase
MEQVKTILVTQARTGSTRFPGKILKEIEGKSLLQIHLERLKKSIEVSEIIVATTIKEEDNIIYKKAVNWGFSATRGSELDVLDRFYQAVKDKKADWIVRVTSDCPLLDPVLVDKVIDDMNDSILECKQSTDEYDRLMKEFRVLEKDGLVNPETFDRKKPVGRPKSKIIYQWMDYLVSELGTKQKAADYVSDFPITDSKKPDTLKREYRKYCEDKGEG